LFLAIFGFWWYRTRRIDASITVGHDDSERKEEEDTEGREEYLCRNNWGYQNQVGQGHDEGDDETLRSKWARAMMRIRSWPRQRGAIIVGEGNDEGDEGEGKEEEEEGHHELVGCSRLT
jgi:hypothetical protein